MIVTRDANNFIVTKDANDVNDFFIVTEDENIVNEHTKNIYLFLISIILYIYSSFDTHEGVSAS